MKDFIAGLKVQIAFTIMMLMCPFLIFAQTQQELYVKEIGVGFVAVSGFIFWLLSDVIHLAFSENVKKIISVAVAAIVGVVVAWRMGYNPFIELGIFGAITFIIKLLKEVTGVSLTPFDILGIFKGKKV